MVIRKLDGDGLKCIAPLFKAVFSDRFSSHPLLEDAVQGEIVHAAFIGEDVAGFVSVWQEDNFIHFLAVDEKYRHQGVGRFLLSFAEKTFGRPLSLKCLADNEGALGFYSSYGFKAIAEGDSEDGCYLLLRLE